MSPRSAVPRLLRSCALVAALAACARSPRAASAPSPVPAEGARTAAIHGSADLLSAMHGRYAGKWYRTLTFRQTTTIHRASGAPLVQTWHEAVRVPEGLRIDTDTAGGGFLFLRDSIYRFVNGRLVTADTGRNELLVLGFDVYGQSAERTARILRSLGFDLAKFHESTWEGKPVYVVGALAGDTTSKQFWVTRDDLLFVRMLQTLTRGGNRLHQDVRFEKYVRAGGGWVATEVVSLTNGRQTLTEQYADLRTDAPLSDDVFEPKHWSATRNWMR